MLYSRLVQVQCAELERAAKVFSCTTLLRNKARAVWCAGHVTIDFAVLHDSHTLLRMWATDVAVGPSPALAAFQLFDFLAAGDFDPRRGAYTLLDADAASSADTPTGPLHMPSPGPSLGHSDCSGASSAPPLGPGTVPAMSAAAAGDASQRHYVSCELLRHPVLQAVGYEALLRAFRVAGGGFDVATRTGAALSLTDSAAAGAVGAVVAVADCPAAAMRRAVAALELIDDTLAASVGVVKAAEAAELRSIIAALQYLAQQLDPHGQHA